MKALVQYFVIAAVVTAYLAIAVQVLSGLTTVNVNVKAIVAGQVGAL